MLKPLLLLVQAVLRLIRHNSFVVTLLVLCLLCFALREAKADVKGIPYSADFSEAQFPYARVSSGCQTWHKPSAVSQAPQQAAHDQWGAVDFAGACVDLDRCYHTLGQTWGECNARFQDDLRNSCDRDLKPQLGPADPQALTLCYKIAGLYAARAQLTDTPRFFEEAQKTQRAYLDYVAKIIDQTYRSVLQRPASKQETVRALQSLAQGYSLDDLKASLMGARIDADQGGASLPALVPEEEMDP